MTTEEYQECGAKLIVVNRAVKIIECDLAMKLMLRRLSGVVPVKMEITKQILNDLAPDFTDEDVNLIYNAMQVVAYKWGLMGFEVELLSHDLKNMSIEVKL